METNGNNGTNGSGGSSASVAPSAGASAAAPLSGSYHSQASRYSPQNSLTSQHSSLDPAGALAADAITSRPHTPGHNDNNSTHSNIASAAAGCAASAASGKAAIDRTNDTVYTATTSVVKAIMVLSHGVERAVAADYLDLVKNVGFELRALLASVDRLSSVFPAQAHK